MFSIQTKRFNSNKTNHINHNNSLNILIIMFSELIIHHYTSYLLHIHTPLQRVPNQQDCRVMGQRIQIILVADVIRIYIKNKTQNIKNPTLFIIKIHKHDHPYRLNMDREISCGVNTRTVHPSHADLD